MTCVKRDDVVSFREYNHIYSIWNETYWMKSMYIIIYSKISKGEKKWML